MDPTLPLLAAWVLSLAAAIAIGRKYDDMLAAVGVTVLFGPIGLALAYMGAKSKAAQVKQTPPA